MLRAVHSPDVELVLSRTEVHPLAAGLARHQLGVWANEGAAAQTREANPEWDFMGRTFLAWSAAHLALCEPAKKAAHLAAMDGLVDRPLQLEAQHGFRYFLMRYGQGAGTSRSRRAASSSTGKWR